MWNTLLAFLRPPVFEDTERNARARLLHAALLATLVGTLPIAFLNYRLGATGFASFVLILAALSLACVVVNQRGHTRTAALFLTVTMFSASVYTIVDGAGLSDSGVLALTIVITLSSFFFGVPGAWTSVAVSCITLIGLSVAGSRGLIQGALSQPIDLTQLVIIEILILAFGVLTRVVSGAWETSLSAAKQTTARMQMAFDSGGVGIWDWDVEGGDLDVGRPEAEAFGWQPGVALTFDNWLDRLHPGDREPIHTGLSEHLKSGQGTWSAEYRTLGSEGDWRWRLIAGQIAERDQRGEPVRMSGVVLDITDIKRAESALLESERRYRLLTQELHDSVTQTIYSMTLTLKAARTLLEKDPSRVPGLLSELDGLAKEALSEMRGMLTQARPDVLEAQGLVAAIENHIAALEARDVLRVTFAVTGHAALPMSYDLALYRVTQEALNNVIKHAGRTEAEVELALGPAEARLRVQDQGAGFDLGKASSDHDGFGLANMRQRIESVGGNLDVITSPGEGTTILAAVPLARSQDLQGE
jgi:PAS domain S-box-containing protein